jgi:hypothetical protein
VTRLEVKMREFGPTPFPAFAGAAITGVRAQQVLGALLTAPADRRAALLDQLDNLATPLDEADPAEVESIGTPDPGRSGPRRTRDRRPGPTATPGPSRCGMRIRAARIARGWE